MVSGYPGSAPIKLGKTTITMRRIYLFSPAILQPEHSDTGMNDFITDNIKPTTLSKDILDTLSKNSGKRANIVFRLP